jgi:hypothetical protein
MRLPADPIRELTHALERDGKPTLEWVVRWSEGGREPVHAAWARSRDGFRMMRLLRAVGRDETEPLFRALVTHGAWWNGPLGGFPEEQQTEIATRLAAAVRLGAPEPPSLEELLAAYARGVRWLAGAHGCDDSVPRLERGEWPTGWILYCAGAGEVPLRNEWPQVSLDTQVRVLAYTAPAVQAQAWVSLHEAARARAEEALQGGDARTAATMERYAAGALASAELLKKGLAKDAADAFERASREAWSAGAHDDLMGVEVPWTEALAGQCKPTLTELLAGIDRARDGVR